MNYRIVPTSFSSEFNEVFNIVPNRLKRAACYDIYLWIPKDEQLTNYINTLDEHNLILFDYITNDYIIIRVIDVNYKLKKIPEDLSNLTNILFHKLTKKYPNLPTIETTSKLLKLLKPSEYKAYLQELFLACMAFPNSFKNLPNAKHFPYFTYLHYGGYTHERLMSTISYFMDEVIIYHQEAIEYVDKVYNMFMDIINNDKNKDYLVYSRDVRYDLFEHHNSLDILMGLLKVGYVHRDKTIALMHETCHIGLHYVFDNSLHYYVANSYINTREVLERFPYITEDVNILSRYFDNIMPYAIRLRIVKFINNLDDIDKLLNLLVDLGLVISLWVCTCEAGTGSNAWLLHYPMDNKTFNRLRWHLLGWLVYKNSTNPLYQILHIQSTCEYTLPFDMNFDVMLMARDLTTLFDMDFGLDDIINWTLKFIKRFDFVTKLDLSTYIYDDSIYVPSPSGFTFKPWIIAKWG